MFAPQCGFQFVEHAFKTKTSLTSLQHKLERYAHEVELVLIKELSELKRFKSTCSLVVAEDITPKITGVRFENIGEEVVAKIAGSSMWFVCSVSIDGISGDGKDLEVNVTKSIGSEVQTRMRETNIVHDEEVTVRVRTHFQNPKFLPATKVLAKTTVCISFFFLYRMAEVLTKGICTCAHIRIRLCIYCTHRQPLSIIG